jgi:hypothetical protein
MLERLANLARQCDANDPDKVFVVEHEADGIPLDTIKEIAITRVRSSGRYSRLLSLFSMYPAEPANVRYLVNYQLAIMTVNKRIIVVTQFSLELKQALQDLLGERLHEIPDEYAPLL